MRSLLAGQRVLNSGPGIGPALPMILNDPTPTRHLLPRPVLRPQYRQRWSPLVQALPRFRVRFRPRERFAIASTYTMHGASSQHPGRDVLCREISFDRFIHHRNERDDVAEWDEWRRTNAVNFILLRGHVTHSNLIFQHSFLGLTLVSLTEIKGRQRTASHCRNFNCLALTLAAGPFGHR
jgi:hypothetical protein